MQSKCHQKLRDVIAANPDLPIIVLSHEVGGDYDSYYQDVTDVSVEDLVFPNEVESLYGDTYGLNPERFYADVDEVQDDIEGWLYDNDHGSEFYKGAGFANQYFDWVKVYGPIAKMMAKEMPSHKYIVIEADW